jgi:hypothetical protein
MVTILDLPVLVKHYILDFIHEDVLEFTRTRMVCKTLFSQAILDQHRLAVTKLSINKVKNRRISTSAGAVATCQSYKNLRNLDLSFFSTMRAKHVNRIGERCIHIEELNLSGASGVYLINMFYFPSLKVLITTGLQKFSLANHYDKNTREKYSMGYSNNPPPPPPRHLRRYIGTNLSVVDPTVTIENHGMLPKVNVNTLSTEEVRLCCTML